MISKEKDFLKLQKVLYALYKLKIIPHWRLNIENCIDMIKKNRRLHRYRKGIW